MESMPPVFSLFKLILDKGVYCLYFPYQNLMLLMFTVNFAFPFVNFLSLQCVFVENLF